MCLRDDTMRFLVQRGVPRDDTRFPRRFRRQPASVSDNERAELRGVETEVDAAGGDQFVVAAFLGDARFIDHHDAVGVLDGGPGDAAAARAPLPRPALHHQLHRSGRWGSWPRPGEISLVHRGVLFLDELPEFGATKLEGLRQLLEDRSVTLARAAGTLSFPSNFTLIAAMNPCPCGYHGDPRRACTCAAGAVNRYQK